LPTVFAACAASEKVGWKPTACRFVSSVGVELFSSNAQRRVDDVFVDIAVYDVAARGAVMSG
jgi:hypothetical protein